MKKKKKWLCILCVFSILFTAMMIPAAFSPTVYAEEDEGDNKNEDESLAPYFIIHNPDSTVDCFPLKATDVTTNISGVIAETYVTQTYTNEGENPISATYVFPASSSVTIHGLTMEIGNNRVTAQIKEKEEAKQEYEEAKSEGKSASLLEQERPNVFTMNVANIMPGDTARIELHYTELITPADGIYKYVFPTVVGPRYASPSVSGSDSGDNDWIASPYLADGETPPGEYHITVNLSTGVPIADVTCKSHDIGIKKLSDTEAQITLADPEDYAGNRDFILKYKLTGEDVQSGLMLASGEEENYFMLTVQPPERYTSEDIPPREYIFVLDVSGSMDGYPLDTAKELIKDLVSGLKETDTFNLILFSDTSSQLAFRSMPATDKNVKSALELIDNQKGGGGTSLAPALKNAITIPKEDDTARSIVVITDGYISDESEIFDTINRNMDTASFFSFGIGSSVNDYLIGGIAKAGMGESFVVTNSVDAEDSAEHFRTYIESPLLTDIAVTYDGFEVYDVEPSIPATLFAQKPIVLFGKWQGEPSGTIRVTGKSGSKDYVQEIDVSDVEVTEGNDAISYLWARTRLERLTDYGSNSDDPDVKKEVTEIGLKYSMMTSYTSFVAVVETIRNPEKESTDVDQALPLPLGVSNLAVGGGYLYYSEPESIILILLVSGILLFHVLHRKTEKKRNCIKVNIRTKQFTKSH